MQASSFSLEGSYEVRLMINDSILRHKKRPIWPLNLYQNIKIYNSVNGSIPLLISSIDCLNIF
jgi:hypothetical protein